MSKSEKDQTKVVNYRIVKVKSKCKYLGHQLQATCRAYFQKHKRSNCDQHFHVWSLDNRVRLALTCPRSNTCRTDGVGRTAGRHVWKAGGSQRLHGRCCQNMLCHPQSMHTEDRSCLLDTWTFWQQPGQVFEFQYLQIKGCVQVEKQGVFKQTRKCDKCENRV